MLWHRRRMAAERPDFAAESQRFSGDNQLPNAAEREQLPECRQSSHGTQRRLKIAHVPCPSQICTANPASLCLPGPLLLPRGRAGLGALQRHAQHMPGAAVSAWRCGNLGMPLGMPLELPVLRCCYPSSAPSSLRIDLLSKATQPGHKKGHVEEKADTGGIISSHTGGIINSHGLLSSPVPLLGPCVLPVWTGAMSEFNSRVHWSKRLLSVAQGCICHRQGQDSPCPSPMLCTSAETFSQSLTAGHLCVFWGKVFKSELPPGLSALSVFSPGGARAVRVKPLLWE